LRQAVREGANCVKCDLTATCNGLAYAGSVVGREIVYERSHARVQNDLDRDTPASRESTRR
jgi:hypothetical protein